MFDLLELADRANSANAWQNLSPPVQLALTLGSLALLPAALMTMTCFTRVVIVLSFVRQGLATQGVPPNTVVIGLALFLTAFIMRPTLDEIGDKAVRPYLDKTLDACIDGTPEAGTMKMKMNITGNATLAQLPGAAATLNILSEMQVTQSEPAKK